MIGLTLGDAAGIGPELVLRAWPLLRRDGPLVVYGSVAVLEAAARALEAVGAGPLAERIVRVDAPSEAAEVGDALAVIDVGVAAADEAVSEGAYPWGLSVPAFGQLQYAALTRAIDDALAGTLKGMVTAPWNKARLADAGLPPTGHTEVLRERSGVEDVVMVLAGDVLRVALATVHVPLKDVVSSLSAERLERTLRIFEAALRDDWGIREPHVAVCGLNPHAGEGGVMGDEEQTLISPLVSRVLADGVKVSGPWPADTLFPRVVHGHYRADGIVAMYHDQGLAPLKAIHFGEAANVTAGLPYIRTSVDHGTAYDIAGRGAASLTSFVYATTLARRMVKRRAQGAALQA